MKCLLFDQDFCEAEEKNPRDPRAWCCFYDGHRKCAYSEIDEEREKDIETKAIHG